jgi:hypothetical protein
VQHGYRRMSKVAPEFRSRARIMQSCADTTALSFYPTLVPERMGTVITRVERLFPGQRNVFKAGVHTLAMSG